MSEAVNSTVESADGSAIAFTSTGAGPTLIIVDGAMSYREFSPTVQQLAEALSDRHTVITYDRRGRGGSSDRTGDADPVRAEIADLAALIDQAGGPAIVFGFSSGAVLSLEAALAGLPISGLILYEAPFVVSTDRPPVGDDYRERVLRALAEDRPGDAVALFLTEAGNLPAEFVEPMRAELYWQAMEQLAPTLPHDAAIMGRSMSGDPTALQRFSAVTVPTLVLYGGASDAWFAAGSTAIADLLPDASLQELAGQDHDVAVDALAPAVSAWLSVPSR